MSALHALDESAGVSLITSCAALGSVCCIVRQGDNGEFRVIATDDFRLPRMLRAAADQLDERHCEHRA